MGEMLVRSREKGEEIGITRGRWRWGGVDSDGREASTSLSCSVEEDAIEGKKYPPLKRYGQEVGEGSVQREKRETGPPDGLLRWKRRNRRWAREREGTQGGMRGFAFLSLL
jgi:hypothetical protein